jgi:hypothetical protein
MESGPSFRIIGKASTEKREAVRHRLEETFSDHDGMSVVDIGVVNGQRFYADKCTPEFWAPENIGLRPDKFHDGEAHDRFALAAIIFMLLNQGLHPYQGVMPFDEPGTETVAGKIKSNLYPYGAAKGRIAPHKSSLYPFLLDETKSLFDRAFSQPNFRPLAEEWLRHLNQLALQSEICEKDPKYHLKYPQAGCPVCARDQLAGDAPQWAALVGSLTRPTPGPVDVAPSPPPTAPINAGGADAPPGGGTSRLPAVLSAVGFLSVGGVFYMIGWLPWQTSPPIAPSTPPIVTPTPPQPPPRDLTRNPPIVTPKPVQPPPPPPPPKPSVATVMRTSGLMGVWAADCNQGPSGNNQHFRYFVTQNDEGRMSIDEGVAKSEFIIPSAESAPNNRIELKLERLPHRTGQYVVLLMDGSRYRTWTNTLDGRNLVVNGMSGTTGQQTSWRLRGRTFLSPVVRVMIHSAPPRARKSQRDMRGCVCAN